MCIAEMCPKTKTDCNTHVINKRELVAFIIRGVLLLAGVIIGAGIGTATLIKTYSNRDKIEELQARYSVTPQNIRILEDNINNTNTVVMEVVEKFNATILKLEDHEDDYEELKYKSVAQANDISGVISRLQIGKLVLLETTRQWRRGKLLLPLLEYMNITLPCNQLCSGAHQGGTVRI